MPIGLMPRKKGVLLATFLISDRWWVLYRAAAIRRVEETVLEDLNTVICFIHDHNFFSFVNRIAKFK